jgi:HPt (histidine-containing phosphotransfer) domain-containing protein
MENQGPKNSLINPDVWKNLESLEKDGNTGFLQEIIHLFLESAPEMIKKFELAAFNKNFVELSATAHSFKSSCQSIGALSLAEQLEKIELSANQSPPAVNITLVQETAKLAIAVLLEIKSRKA